MSTAVIDTLLQTVAAARPAEPSPRPGDDRGAFRPALDDALRCGEAPTSCPPPLVEPSADDDEEATADDQPVDQHGDPTAETVEVDPADESAAEQAIAEDEADEDDDEAEDDEDDDGQQASTEEEDKE